MTERCKKDFCLRQVNPAIPGHYFGGEPFVEDERWMACYLCKMGFGTTVVPGEEDPTEKENRYLIEQVMNGNLTITLSETEFIECEDEFQNHGYLGVEEKFGFGRSWIFTEVREALIDRGVKFKSAKIERGELILTTTKEEMS